MHLQHRTFALSKGGPGQYRYEDASAADPVAGRFAVADGATEGAFAGDWARLLCQRFVSSADASLVPWDAAWLAATRENWIAGVRRQLASRYGGAELPWYVDSDVRRGAFATFIGVAVAPAESAYRVRAAAVGDACFFHSRSAGMISVFPLGASCEFTNLPPLLASCPEADDGDPRGEICETIAQPGDQLWLATDALAQWCLAEEERRRSPWRRLARLLPPSTTDERFARWIERLRNTKGLRNDDVTLLAVTLM